MKSGLKFLTLNCWGLPFLTPQKNRRLDAITEIIRNGRWDVVALQEVWLKRDQERLIRNSGYPYHVAFPGASRLMGSGLVLLSRFKILASDFHKFVVNGFPHRVHEGDFHASKGIGYALLDTPLGKLPVFVTHLIAKYARRHEQDINRVFRMAQILELVFYMRRKATPGSFVLCGDLNVTDEEMEFESLLALTGITGVPRPKLRTFRKRLDHILCGGTHDNVAFKVASSSLVFRNAFSPEQLPYSDHEGVSAVIRPAQVAVNTSSSQRVLARTRRYMTYSLQSVQEIDNWLRLLPILGLLSSALMKPQLEYVHALLTMLESDIELAVPLHPLRLKEIV